MNQKGNEPPEGDINEASTNGEQSALEEVEQNDKVLNEVRRIGAGILNLVHTVAFEPKTVARKGRFFPFAFDIDEERIHKIDYRINNSFSSLQIYPQNLINFKANVRFPDLSEKSFDSIDRMLDEAGDKQDPERLLLEWKALLQDPIASMALI